MSGVIHLDLDRNQAALAALQRAVALAPDSARAQYHLGNALQRLDRHQEAEGCYRAALARAPGFGNALNNLGNTLRSLGRDEEAIACFRAVLEHAPDHVPSLYNLGRSLARLGRLEEAESSLRAAIAGPVRPAERHRLAEVHDSLAAVLIEQGRDLEALAETRTGLRINPAQPLAEWNESLMLLRLGRFAEAWPKYERRWELPGFREGAEADKPPPAVPLPDALAGKRVLLRGEQGRGDVIQFARYAPLLARCAAGVTLAVFPDLVRLMQSLAGVNAIADDAEPPAHDAEASLLSLPLAFGTELGSIPAACPYLAPDPALRAAWGERLGLPSPSPCGRGLGEGSRRKFPRIGLCWRGSQHIPERSIPLSLLAPLLAVPGVAFHAVQVGAESDRALLAAHGVVDHGPALSDFADTAALLSWMDLVISIDTALAHLAGALGLPTWILLRRNADWRWLLHREDTPWYPTARLFRQAADGTWPAVIERVAAALADRPGG